MEKVFGRYQAQIKGVHGIYRKELKIDEEMLNVFEKRLAACVNVLAA